MAGCCANRHGSAWQQCTGPSTSCVTAERFRRASSRTVRFRTCCAAAGTTTTRCARTAAAWTTSRVAPCPPMRSCWGITCAFTSPPTRWSFMAYVRAVRRTPVPGLAKARPRPVSRFGIQGDVDVTLITSPPTLTPQHGFLVARGGFSPRRCRRPRSARPASARRECGSRSRADRVLRHALSFPRSPGAHAGR
jgi:hypothetical protein